MLPELSTGALDRIMNGEEVDRPIFQILGHKKLGSNNSGDRYRLLLSDGVKSNSFTMLATQLNHLVTDNTLSTHSICRVNQYAISMVNNSGTQRRVMVILSIDVIKPGEEVGREIGNVSEQSNKVPESEPERPNGTTSAPSRNHYPQSNQMNETSIQATPIAGLSPYQNKWVIKARVTSKPPVRTWSNSRGEGKLFSMDLVDESGEIRCTAFKAECDKFYDMIEVGKVYFISRGQLKPANTRFNNLKNDYEITLGHDSEIIQCHDNVDDIPTLQFDFTPISQIENKPKDEMIDVLGIVKSQSDVVTLTAKSTGRELKKRDVNLVDQSNVMVTITLWGTQAEEFDGSNNPVIAIKGARIGEFNGGKNLSTISSSTLQIDPDLPQAHKLRGWFRNEGHSGESRSISRGLGSSGSMTGIWATFKEAQEQRFGHENCPDTYLVKASVNMIRSENCLYKACPSEGCKKKVLDLDNSMYRCEKCNRDFPNYTYRLLASANLVDWTGHQWTTAFSEQAEILMGGTAQELGELKERNNDEFMEKIGEANFKSYMFKLRVRMENYNDETRLKANIVNLQPVNYKVYNEQLLTKIKELMNMSKS